MTNIIEFPQLIDGEDKTSPLKNRIRKNYKHVRKWAKRAQTDCFRIYDHEVREYPLAIDYYAGRYCLHYFAKSREDDEAPESLVKEAESALYDLFGVHSDALFWRSRIRRRKTQQYEKQADSRDFFTVQEYGAKFEVNLVNYLDTGLFLDHRETRQLVAQCCRDKRLLNLFAYTCSFSIHAALAGAQYTKSVDLSNTYTAWGRRNFELNGISPQQHEIVRADCLRFLEEAFACRESYDVIVVDPPTLSRSKKMDGLFDVQADYIALLSLALRLLSEGGVLFFSTNSRKFRFDETAFPDYDVRDISAKTLPIDFYSPKIHRCWRISASLNL